MTNGHGCGHVLQSWPVSVGKKSGDAILERLETLGTSGQDVTLSLFFAPALLPAQNVDRMLEVLEVRQ